MKFIFAFTLALPLSAADLITIEALNPLPIARTSQTIEVSAKDLKALGEKDLSKVWQKSRKVSQLPCK